MGSQSRGWRRDWIATGHKERKPGALGSYDPGWNAEDLFESCNPEPDLDSQRNNLGGLYGNIDGFVLGAPRDVVGARGCGTCSHGAGRVTVLRGRRLGSAARGGCPARLLISARAWQSRGSLLPSAGFAKRFCNVQPFLQGVWLKFMVVTCKVC